MVKEDALLIGGAALLLMGGLWWLTRGQNAQATGQALGGGVIDFGGGVITGGVKEIGSLFGVPDTDPDLAEAARRRGDVYEASKYMPAKQFITWVAGGMNTGGASGSW